MRLLCGKILAKIGANFFFGRERVKGGFVGDEFNVREVVPGFWKVEKGSFLTWSVLARGMWRSFPFLSVMLLLMLLFVTQVLWRDAGACMWMIACLSRHCK